MLLDFTGFPYKLAGNFHFLPKYALKNNLQICLPQTECFEGSVTTRGRSGDRCSDSQVPAEVNTIITHQTILHTDNTRR